MSEIIKNSINKKLMKLSVSKSSLTAFNKEIDKIIASKYQVSDKLKKLKSSISTDNKTITKCKKSIADDNREIKNAIKIVKETKNNVIDEHLKNVPTSFVNKDSINGRNALMKVLSHIPTKDMKLKQFPVFYKKKGIVSIKVKKVMTREQIKKLGNQISKTMKDHGIIGEIGIAMRYSNMWAPAMFVDYGKNVRLYSEIDSDSYNEQENYSEIEIFISEKANSKGKGIANNDSDCLYQCLWYYLHDGLPWKNDYQMKKALGIKHLIHYIGVDIKYMQRLEELLKISINVTGNYVYTSTLKSNLVINLILENEHYSVDYKKIDNRVKKISNDERIPLIWNRKTNLCYFGSTIQPYKKSFDIFNIDSKYILIDCNEKEDQCLIKQYDEFIKNADLLKEKSLINLYQTGTIASTALFHFDRFTHHIKEPTHIYQAEAQFIKNSTTGALIFGEKYEGEGHKFDIVSSYPSIMNSNFCFPIKEGEFINLTKDEFNNIEFFKYGIYRCHVSGINKQFRINKLNHYTHIDLTEARRLKLTITLIVDNQPNFLYYSRDKLLVGTQIFKQYIDSLFLLKKQGIKISKSIINILWGKLSEIKIDKHYINDSQTTIDDDLKNIFPLNDDNYKITTTKPNFYYKYGWARIAPFIFSKGREKIAKIINQFGNDNIVRCHTDGIISKIYPTDVKIGCKLGDLKFEESSNLIKIINTNSIHGFIKKIGK